MSRRPFGLSSLILLLLVLGLLGAAGLGWVTAVSLKVEDDQRASAAAAERAETERLALWKLDGRIAPALGLEGYRPFEDFTGLYAPPGEGPGGVQYLSPLVSIGLPDWIPLHFQFDPAVGWTSPQVLPASAVNRLANPGNDLDLSNLTDDRRERLATLNRRFSVANTASRFKPLDAETSAASAAVAVVLARGGEGTTPTIDPPPPGAMSPKSQGFAGNARGGLTVPPPYAGNPAAGQATQQGGGRNSADKGVTDDNVNRSRFGEKVVRDVAGGLGNTQIVNDATEPPTKGTGSPPSGEMKKMPETKGDPRATTPHPAPPALGGRPGAGPAGPGGSGMPGGGGGGFGGGAAPARGAVGGMAPAGPPGAPLPPIDANKAKQAETKDRAEPPPGPMALAMTAKAAEKAAVDPPNEAAAKRRNVEELPLAVKKPAPPVPPVSVHLGAMRPMWLADETGERMLVVVRPARLEGKTVYQGAVLDWDRLREVLKEEVADDFPAADLIPVNGPSDEPHHQLSTLPVRFDSGPPPALPSAGWTPLRLGLGLAWLAGTVAWVAVGFGGWSLVDLSERRIRFVSAVTHELRTPLTSLRLYLDMLTSGMVTDETQKAQYLTTLSHESNRLNQLIENVLDFAKLEKRAGAIQKRSVPVSDLLEHGRETWAERLAADGKEFVAISTVPDGQAVTTDPRVAQQILGNLIDNARKYSPGAADPRIWLWVKPAGRRVAFEVEDRGPGIPAAERVSIFRPFRRGHASGATGGAGLGLALAKQWAESLGGKLTYRPADGGTGACFRLELPA